MSVFFCSGIYFILSFVFIFYAISFQKVGYLHFAITFNNFIIKCFGRVKTEIFLVFFLGVKIKFRFRDKSTEIYIVCQ